MSGWLAVVRPWGIEGKGGRVMLSPRGVWVGRVMSGLVILFLVMDIAMKLANLNVVAQASLQLGWDPGKARTLGVILLVCTALYAYPRTTILGATLLTGYLGGAVAAHARLDDPLFTHVLFGVYLGILAWGGLWLRDPRLRVMFPLRQDA
jgi:hypothetical protein